ncbi:hypothetical protein [Amycolatopsis sp. MtRt-6]|uniref:hypothetical protein n=1 Tax=Amycolatopsis sp. MtRt-6 TaxID=2792782 RepID=UPI001A8D51DD|nr:hypothetical protein [Amycolatopsis sp. MtRt-6]
MSKRILAAATAAAAMLLTAVPATAVAAPVSAVATSPVLGDVIPSGFGDVVFYGVPVRIPQLPETTFGIMAGARDAAGGLTNLVATNETSGSDKAPGFHAVSGGMTVNGHEVPSFGYYYGPAAKITGRIWGTTGVAHQARWSEDPNVVVFWFDPGVADPENLQAFDAAGTELPAGDTGVGHG